jgi:hypothetical protein
MKIIRPRWCPHIDIRIDLGFFEVSSQAWYERHEARTTEWVSFRIRFLRWDNYIRLYTPHK